MYKLQWKCPNSKWFNWRDCEEPLDTPKHKLKFNLKAFRQAHTGYNFRYVKSIQITYSRDIVIE